MAGVNKWFGDLRTRVRGGAGQLRYPPWRRRVLVLLVVFPFALGAILAVTLGPIEGIAGFGTAFSLPAFFRHDLVPGPRLSTAIVTASDHSREAVFPSTELRVIDRRAIIKSEQCEAQETAPEIRREPRRGSFGLPSFEVPSVGSMLGPTQRDLEQFTAEIRRYGDELEPWLERYAELRIRSTRQFRLALRIENDGEAPAQNVRLRVRFPKDFRRLTKPMAMDGAPSQPRFRDRWQIDPVVPLQSSALKEIGRRLTAEPVAGPVPIASHEKDHLVLTYDIGHLNHGPDHMRTEPVTLLAPRDGEFELQWDALSANPGPAARGTMKVRLNPILEVEPAIRTMKELDEDQRLHHIEQA